MPKQDDADADDDAAAAADIRRVEVVETFLIVDQAPRVRFSYAAPRGDGSSGNTSGLHPGIRGSNPRRSTGGEMLKPLSIRNQLWRLCTNSTSYRSRPGGIADLQNRRVEFDSLAACRLDRWSSGQAPDCKSGLRGFESRPVFKHVVVVTPTQGPRTGAYHPCAGLAQFGRATVLHAEG